MTHTDDPIGWALRQCYRIAQRRAKDGRNDLLSIQMQADWAAWRHIIRICEEAGLQPDGILRSNADGKGAMGVGDQQSLKATSGPDTAPNPDRKSPRRLTS